MKRCLFLYAGWFALALAASAQAAQTVLYEKASRFGTIIVTEEDNGLRTLRFGKDGPRQSVVKPGDPDYLALAYTRFAFIGLALCEESRRFLVVGLGGGTLPGFLRRHYPEATIDAVDIDPEVVHVAKAFFGFREDERMRAHVGDGRDFIQNARQPYDAIFLDAFGSDSVPPHLVTQEFLQAVRRAIKPAGVVVSNVWSNDSNRLYDAMIRTHQEVFDELFILDVPGSGNKILLALPRRQALDRDELARLARKVSAARQFRFDLGELAGRGFLHARDKKPGERVLRDP